MDTFATLPSLGQLMCASTHHLLRYTLDRYSVKILIILVLSANALYAQQNQLPLRSDSIKASSPYSSGLEHALTKASSHLTTSLGLKAGGAFTTKTGRNVPSQPETKPVAGIVAGIYQTIPLGRYGPFYLQPELLFSMQGHRLSHPSTQYEATLHHYYVCLPILLAAAYKNFFLEAGPQLGYLVGVNERFDHMPIAGAGGTVTYTTSVGYNHDTAGYQRWEAAYVAGIGYRWHQGLGVEVRYVGGLTNVYTSSSHILNSTPTGQYNQGAQLQVSYSLQQ